MKINIIRNERNPLILEEVEIIYDGKKFKGFLHAKDLDNNIHFDIKYGLRHNCLIDTITINVFNDMYKQIDSKYLTIEEPLIHPDKVTFAKSVSLNDERTLLRAELYDRNRYLTQYVKYIQCIELEILSYKHNDNSCTIYIVTTPNDIKKTFCVCK